MLQRRGCFISVVVFSLLTRFLDAASIPTQVKWATNPTKCLAARLVHSKGAAIKIVNCQDGSYWQTFSYDRSTGQLQSASHPDKCLSSYSGGTQPHGEGAFLETCEDDGPSSQFAFDEQSGQLKWADKPDMCLHVQVESSTGGFQKCKGTPDEAFTIQTRSKMTKSSQDLPAAPTNLEEDEKQDDSLDEGAKPSMLRDERKQAKPPVDQPASLFTKTASSQTSNNTPQYFHFDSNKIYVSTEPESKKISWSPGWEFSEA